MKPIKTKSAKEVTTIMLDYICTFGPPTEIIHDFGREWYNELFKGILEGSGINQKITSAYRPQSNGMVERLIASFMQSLKSMCNDDIDNWPAYVKFTQLAYNTKVHSRTRFTPLELLTGINAYPFEDFTNKNLYLLANSVTCDRALEDMRSLQQHKREAAVSNIEKAQWHQIKGQNERRRITTNRLQIGTKVYLEIKGLHDKLHQKYKGPYTVVEVDELRGTYKLADQKGKVLNDKFQLSRLKLDLEAETELEETKVGKVHEKTPEVKNTKTKLNDKEPTRRSARIGARAVTNLISFVFWLSIATSVLAEPVIVSKLAMNCDPCNKALEKKLATASDKIKNLTQQLKMSGDLQNKYSNLYDKEKKRDKKDQINKQTILINKEILNRSSERDNKTQITLDASVYTLRNRYSVCERNKDLWSRPILFNNECTGIRRHTNESSKLLFSDTSLHNMNVLSKVSHEVQGNVFICEIEQIEVRTYKNFFGAKSQEIKINSIRLSEIECKSMIETKECRGNLMICNEKLCKFDGTPAFSYSYLSESVKLGYSCKLKTRFISLRNRESIIFLKCKVKELKCALRKSIAVWKEDIIMKCPYKFITKIDELVSKPYNILTNSRNALFKVTSLISICDNIRAYKTTEGLVISEDNDIIKRLPKSEIEFSAIHELILSEADNNFANLIDKINNLRIQNCLIQTEILNVIQLEDDKYFRIFSQKNKNIILYVKNNLLHVPRCFDIDKITINQEQSAQCSSDIEVKFKVNDKVIVGFLNDNRIIRMNGRNEKCKGAYIQKESGGLIIKNDKHLHIRNITNKISTENLLQLSEAELNFIHLDELLKGINIFDEIVEHDNNLLEDELDVHHEILDFVGNTKIATSLGFKEEVLTDLMSYWFRNWRGILMTLSSIILIIVLLTVMGMMIKKLNNMKMRRRDRRTMLEIHGLLQTGR